MGDTLLTSKVPSRERLGIVAGAELQRKGLAGRWREEERHTCTCTSVHTVTCIHYTQGLPLP